MMSARTGIPFLERLFTRFSTFVRSGTDVTQCKWPAHMTDLFCQFKICTICMEAMFFDTKLADPFLYRPCFVMLGQERSIL